MAEYKDTVAFTKNKMDELRSKIATLRDTLNTHIGEAGSLHPIATTEQSGFMSVDQYKDLTETLESLYQQALAALQNAQIPSGTTCWYYGDPDDLPEGWSLTSANSSNPLYPMTTISGGASIIGMNGTSYTGKAGHIYEYYYNDSTKGLTTLALYSIRKD